MITYDEIIFRICQKICQALNATQSAGSKQSLGKAKFLSLFYLFMRLCQLVNKIMFFGLMIFINHVIEDKLKKLKVLLRGTLRLTTCQKIND